MKLSIGLLTLLLGSLLMFGCSEHIPNKHEQLYLDTADSLNLYKDYPYIQKEFKANQMARDFTELNFIDFKEKHEMSNAEMKVLAKIMQGHINIAKTINSVNADARQLDEIDQNNRKIFGDSYSFKKEMAEEYRPMVDSNVQIEWNIAE